MKSHIIRLEETGVKTAPAANLNMDESSSAVKTVSPSETDSYFRYAVNFWESPEKRRWDNHIVIRKYHYCSPQIALPLIDCTNNRQDLNTHSVYTTNNSPLQPSHDSWRKHLKQQHSSCWKSTHFAEHGQINRVNSGKLGHFSFRTHWSSQSESIWIMSSWTVTYSVDYSDWLRQPAHTNKSTEVTYNKCANSSIHPSKHTIKTDSIS